MSEPAPGAAIGRARLRREARERALELSYEQYQREVDLDVLMASLTLPPEPYTQRLLSAVDTNVDDLDRMIGRRLRGWTVDRLPVLDLLVLRLAVAELTATDTPTGVVLSEAVDLASRYGTDESAKFVNGVLAAMVDDVRPAISP